MTCMNYSNWIYFNRFCIRCSLNEMELKLFNVIDVSVAWLASQNSSKHLNDTGVFLQAAIQMFAIRFWLWGGLSSQPLFPLPEASVAGLGNNGECNWKLHLLLTLWSSLTDRNQFKFTLSRTNNHDLRKLYRQLVICLSLKIRSLRLKLVASNCVTFITALMSNYLTTTSP